ncbi:MAG: hypothetical protein JWQ69_5770 [Pseudomonas sp.]|nr:hypothetical protein [Pseudomonas sp.]
MRKVATTVLICSFLIGCASSPVPLQQATAVPAERIMAYQKEANGSGALSITRDSGHTGSFCDIGLFVDGKVSALLKPGENVVIHLPAGQVIVGAAYQGGGICGMGAERQERDIVITSGKTKKYRISTSGDGVLDILPTTI